MAIGLALLALAAPAAARHPGGGYNDFSCVPSKGHTRPVVLVHGTFLDRSSWSYLAPKLAARGYCVYSLDYGNRATAPVADSALEVKAFIERVLEATGARKVAVVGHSQGGMLPRQIIKFDGGRRLIAELVALSPSNHGTDQPAAGPLGATVCPACKDQLTGSPFLNRLNAGDETPGKISYTVIQTSYDEVVTPYTSAFLAAGPKTTNVLLQDACPSHVVDHVLMPQDPLVAQYVFNALRRQGQPANGGLTPRC